MTSKFGTKTYSRQKVCQSSIQFDQLFNEKGNKPTAAKSKGTLHRWGMTSFTSVRNSHVNGRKEDTDIVDNSLKRRKMDIALDDPFSFDLEPDALQKPCKVNSNVPQTSFPPSSVATSVSAPKTNKFFKSGASRSIYKLKQTPESSQLPKPHSVLVTVHKEPFLEDKPSLAHDAFSQLLLSSGVSTVSGNPIDTCLSFKDDTSLSADVLSTYSVAQNVCNYSTSSALVNHTYNYEQTYYDPQHTPVALHRESIFPSSTHPDVNLEVPRVCSAESEVDLRLKETEFCMVNTLDLMRKPDTEVFENELTAVETKLDIPIKHNDEVLGVEINMDSKLNLDSKPCEPVEDVFEAVDLEVGDKFVVNKSEDAVFENKDMNVDINLLPPCVNKSDFTESEDSSDIGQESNALISSVFSDKECYASDSPLDLKLQMEDSQDDAHKESSSETSDRATNSSMPYRSLSVLRQRRIFNSPKKIDRRALYKHRPWQVEEEPLTEELSTSSQPTTLSEEFDFFDDDSGKTEKPLLTRVTTWPIREGDEAVTSVKCSKKFKELYAVVRNVKQAHQCHESGETQEFNDDVDYLLDGLQGSNSVATRCLSILSLAGKCMAPSFRMHLRAHGTLTKVFSALQDAPKETNLSLCTATVLFILSQDRLNMDLERSSLELMLQLLETESGLGNSALSTATNGHSREFDKNKEKVRDLCDQLQKKGYAKHIDVDNITASVLAMETLLSLTSRRAGEWFKEELRELGGLDHLVNTVSECGKCLPGVFIRLTEFALDKLRKLDRCLRVLENVTVMNVQNQAYLITCQESSLIVYCSRALKLCESCLKQYPSPDNSDREGPSWILFSCLLSVLKVLLNLTNENSLGSAKVGEQEGLISSALSCILDIPSHLQVEQRFDLLVLALGLVINLVEYCETNRQRVFYAEVTNLHKSSSHNRRAGTITAPKALVTLFMEHEEAARVEELKTDNLLDGKGDGDATGNDGNVKAEDTVAAPTSQEDIEETLKKALQKAGKNMEDSMIAAYIALLLGCLIQDNRDHANKIRDHFPNKDFNSMVQILKKFLNFMNLTNIVGSTGMKSIQRVIDILEAT